MQLSMKYLQFILLYLLCNGLYAQPSIMPITEPTPPPLGELQLGDRFINFKAFDVNQNEFEFSSVFDGKPVLLVFSSLYCHWCTETLPLLEQLQQDKDNRFHLILFYVDDEQDAHADFAQKSSYPWISVWDPTRAFTDYMRYPLQATPTFYLFDATGKFMSKREGYQQDLKEFMEHL